MRTFFPQDSRTVDASFGDAKYVVGIGHEMWGNDPIKVLKIQIATNGNVAGRKSPSFPVEEDRDRFPSCPDFDKVAMKVEQIVKPLRTWLITWDCPYGGGDVSKVVSDAIKSRYTLSDDDINRPCLQIRTIEIQSGTASDVVNEICSELRKANAPKGIRVYAARLADADHEIV